MRTYKCPRCGKLFEKTKSDAYLCAECAEAARKTGVYRQHICEDCGSPFWGYPRSKRCPDCQCKVERQRKRRQNKYGAIRPLGSIDQCESCGKDYVVNSGLQRYCKACAEAAILANTRAHKRAYNAANPDIINKARQLRSGNGVCAVCGGLLPKGIVAVTCSPECAAEQLRRNRQKAERNRTEKKRAQRVKKEIEL